MADDRLTWLHCSDFHVGKDRTAQERLLRKIVEHVRERVASGLVPDLVFITGDLANRGVNPEYKDFNEGFIAPLREALGGNTWQGRILAVLGNHDADRTKANDFDRDGVLAPGTRFFDPRGEGKAAREILFPRFKRYRQKASVDLSGNWSNDATGAFAEVIAVRGIKVGVNTAWLSKDDKDKERLTPGVELTEAARREGTYVPDFTSGTTTCHGTPLRRPLNPPDASPVASSRETLRTPVSPSPRAHPARLQRRGGWHRGACPVHRSGRRRSRLLV